MVCGNCGNYVQDGAPNCPNCGAPMGMNPNGMNQPPMGMNPNGMNQGPMGMNPNGMNQPPMGMNPGGMYQGPMGMNPGGMYQGPMGMNPGGMYQGPMGMTKKQFYNHPAMKTIKTNIISCGVIGYVLTGLNLLMAFLLPSSGANLLDTLLILGLSLGLHLGKSRVCAILMAVYGMYNIIIALIVFHRLSGWLIPVMGIYACIYTFKFHSAWKKYQETGQIVPTK